MAQCTTACAQRHTSLPLAPHDDAGALSERIPKPSTFTDAELAERHNCAVWDSISNY